MRIVGKIMDEKAENKPVEAAKTKKTPNTSSKKKTAKKAEK